MTALVATVDEMTFVGEGHGPWVLSDLDGWTDGPPVRSQGSERRTSHGSFAIPAQRAGRIVTLSGFVVGSSSENAGAIRRRLAAVLGDGGFGDLTVAEHDGLVTSTLVQVNAAPLVRWNPSVDVVEFSMEFFAPDPLRYGPVQNLTTGFPALVGGLEFDLFTDGTDDVGWLEFGEAGSSGRLVVVNPGTAESWAQYQVVGPTPPFTIACVESGDRLVFSRALSAGEVLLINSATGLVVLNGGDVDYSGLLTRAEWFPVPKRGSCTVAFLPDGPTDSGTLTVIHRPAWW